MQQPPNNRPTPRPASGQGRQPPNQRGMSPQEYSDAMRREAFRRKKAAEKRRKMFIRRRIMFGLFLVFVALLIFFGVRLILKKASEAKHEPAETPSSQMQTNSTSTDTSASGAPSMPESTPPVEPTASLEPEAPKDAGAFPVATLANENNPLPTGYVPEVEKVDAAGHEFDKRASDALKKMISDGNDTGLQLMICSAYRSTERQTTLFNEMLADNKAKGMSEEEAYDKTKTIRAIPGTSEHETGLAADIVSVERQTLDDGFEKTPEFKWLYENCAEYGFILRYPREKNAITGIIYEPWHYRYVGVETAQKIMSESMCLEEYAELVK